MCFIKISLCLKIFLQMWHWKPSFFSLLPESLAMSDVLALSGNSFISSATVPPPSTAAGGFASISD
jgi:hypothetical protein